MVQAEVQVASVSANRDYSIDAVSKALDILETLGRHERGLSLQEIATACTLPKSSAFRYLVTLDQRGYVERSTEGFRLGPASYELARKARVKANLHEIAFPIMLELRDACGETVNLGVLSRGRVVYLEIIESTQAVRMAVSLGERSYPHATSLGKAIMAFMPAFAVDALIAASGLPGRTPHTITSAGALADELAVTRRRGFAYDDGENEPWARCIGAPILGERGQPVAALSVSAPAERVSLSALTAMAPALAAAARSISTRLGCSQELLPPLPRL